MCIKLNSYILGEEDIWLVKPYEDLTGLENNKGDNRTIKCIQIVYC